MDGALSGVVQRLAAGLDIRTSWPVSHIAYDAGGAVLHGPAGAVIRARKVVVTVPLPVLQRQQLAFSPPLPPPKQQAIERLRMGNAVKLLMAFKQRFWPEHMYDVVCTDSFVPEFWMTRHTVSDKSCAHLHALTGRWSNMLKHGLQHSGCSNTANGGCTWASAGRLVAALCDCTRHTLLSVVDLQESPVHV